MISSGGFLKRLTRIDRSMNHYHSPATATNNLSSHLRDGGRNGCPITYSATDTSLLSADNKINGLYLCTIIVIVSNFMGGFLCQPFLKNRRFLLKSDKLYIKFLKIQNFKFHFYDLIFLYMAYQWSFVSQINGALGLMLSLGVLGQVKQVGQLSGLKAVNMKMLLRAFEFIALEKQKLKNINTSQEIVLTIDEGNSDMRRIYVVLESFLFER
ncbi:hypothetical protein ACJX0J_019668, partial [Zea mays]